MSRGSRIQTFYTRKRPSQATNDIPKLYRDISNTKASSSHTHHHGTNLGAVKKILILYTGGAIGMIKNEKGSLEPCPNKLYETIKHTSTLNDKSVVLSDEYSTCLVLPKGKRDVTIIYNISEYTTLLDSSCVSSAEWIRLAKDIGDYYDKYTGFIILAGSDTICYMASALSFMLEKLAKPVILTGAGIPVYYDNSEGKSNIKSALLYAGCYEIPEVCITYKNNLYRGNRSIKYSAISLSPVTSPNFYTLGEDGELDTSSLLPIPDQAFEVFTALNPNVAVVTIYPAITDKILRAQLCAPLKGVVLQTFGMGNVPTNASLLDVIYDACKRGMILVSVSICSHGTVSEAYEPARQLMSLGVVCGYDMTLETALTKLCYILGKPNMTLKEKKELMTRDLCGEITTVNLFNT